MKKFILIMMLMIAPSINCTGMGHYCGNNYYYDDWDTNTQYTVTKSGSGFHIYGSNGYFGQGFASGFYLD